MKNRLVTIACFIPLILNAAPEESLKVVTYNIGSGASDEWRSQPIDFDRLVSHILEQNPDVVLLQEVHDNFARGRTPVISQPEFWKSRLGMDGHYMPDTQAWSFWGWSLGTAGHMILSKWPIVAVNDDIRPMTRTFPIGFDREVKWEDNKMSVVLDFKGKRVRVANMHIGGADRLLRYLDWLEGFPEPAILGGDANIEWWNESESARARFVTIPNDTITDQCGAIDWIMVQRGVLKTNAWEYGRVNGLCASQPADHLSDHALVYASVGFESVTARNPGFESYLDRWSVWSPNANHVATALLGRLVGIPCHSGMFCGAQAGSGGIIFRDLDGLVPGARYQISAWLWSGPRSMGKLSVHNTAEGNYGETPYQSTQGSWLKLSLVYTADQTGKVRVHFVRSEGSADFTLWDDLEVVPLDR